MRRQAITLITLAGIKADWFAIFLATLLPLLVDPLSCQVDRVLDSRGFVSAARD